MKAVKIIICFILALLLIAILCGIIVFTKGFTTDFQSFYVTLNGEKVLESGSGYILSSDHPFNIDVKYVFGAFSKEATGYSMRILPAVNPENSFDFTVNGELKGFAYEEDLSAAFNIELKENSFTLGTTAQSMADVLSCIYPNSDIEVPENILRSDSELFKLVVTSYNGKQTVIITFGIKFIVPVTGVTVPGVIEI